MKAHYLFATLLGIILLSGACSGSKLLDDKSLNNCPLVATRQLIGKDSVVVCDLSRIKDTLNIPLSQLIEDFQIIKLDNKDEALVQAAINSFVPTSISENYIGMHYFSRMPYKLFDKKGNYLRTIGQIGEGPNEYNLLYYDQIDEKNNRIYLLPWNAKKLLVYDLMGNYLPPIPLPAIVPKGIFHVETEKKIVTLGTLPFQGTKSVIWQQYFQGKVIREIDATPYVIQPDYSNEIYSNLNTESLDYYIAKWSTENDTLYRYSTEENRLVPLFTIQFNTEQIPIHSFSTLPEYYLADITTDVVNGQAMPPLNLIIDKRSLKGTYFNLVNDYLANLPITFPVQARFRNGNFYMNMDPGELSDQLDKALSKSDNLSEDIIRRITDLKNSISPDDNNILFIGKLKSTGGNLSFSTAPAIDITPGVPPSEIQGQSALSTEADTVWHMPHNTANIPQWLSYSRTNNRFKDWDPANGKSILARVLVEKDGTPSEITIKSGSDYSSNKNPELTGRKEGTCGIKELDEEALRLLREATYTPGRDNKKNPVRSYLLVFVFFPAK